jgi:hypothetical protein
MRALQIGILSAAVAGMFALAGCESLRPMGPSWVDQHMGEAVHELAVRQIANPNAVYENTEDPQMDPDSSAAVMDRYYEKQSQPESPQMPSIIQIDAN